MRRIPAWTCAAALAAVIVVPAALAAPVRLPLAKAHRVAAKRLFDYVWPLSYVTDFAVTGCTRTSPRSVACGYRVAFDGGTPCTGMILVGHARRSVTSRFTGGLCTPPRDSSPAAEPAPTPTSPPSTAADPPTPMPSPTPTPTPSPTSNPPAYSGVGATHSLDNVTGDVVTLDDGSQWQTSGSVSGWLYEDVIDVEYSNGAYTLADGNASSGPVAATYLG